LKPTFSALEIVGEIKYTALIVQNLLDNARKYNRRGGTIRIVARRSGKQVELQWRIPTRHSG
jgi:signal transduction histidine kinase